MKEFLIVRYLESERSLAPLLNGLRYTRGSFAHQAVTGMVRAAKLGDGE